MKTEIIEFTKETAQELLKHNVDNYRKVDNRRVRLYAKEMLSGNWELTGDTIKVHKDGNVMDGQHRLLAVIKADVKVKILVVTGITSSAHHIDRGKIRRIPVIIDRMGIPNATNIAAISKNVLDSNNGGWINPTIQLEDVTDSEHIKFIIDNHEKLNNVLRMVAIARSLMPSALLGALIYVATDGDPYSDELPNWFCRSLGTGKGIGEGDPVFLLRELLIKDKSSIQHKKPRFIKKMLLTKAWNATVDGVTMKTLRFTQTGPTKNKPLRILKLND